MEITPEILETIKQYVPGNVAVYRINGTTIESLYFSESLPSMLGMTKDEYTELTQFNASEVVFKEDKPGLMDAVQESIKENKPLDYHYRVIHKTNDVDWVHAMATVCGERDGCPVMLVEYHNASTEQETLYHELIKTKNMYELAVDNASLGVWEFDIKTHTITSSSHSFRKLGIPDVVKNVPESILNLCSEEDQKKLIDMYQRICAGETNIAEEFWMRWKPEQPQRCERVVYSVVKDEKGNPITAYGIGINVTEQKRELDKYNRSLEELLKLNPNALCSFRLNLSSNSLESGHGSSTAIQKLLDVGTVDELFSNIASLITEPDDIHAFTSKFNREQLLAVFSSGKTSVSLAYHRKVDSGEEHCVKTSLNMLKNPGTGDIEAVVYSVDNQQEETDKSIIDSVLNTEYDYIALISVKAKKISLQHYAQRVQNPVAFDAIDYDKTAYDTLSKEIAPEELESCVQSTCFTTVTTALQEKPEYIVSFKCHDIDGHTYRKQLTYRYLNKKHDQIILFRTDITESFKQEQERNEVMQKALLKARHADEMKTTFLSNLSHDMRTPLNAVLGYAGLALKSHNETEMTDYLVKIEKAGNMLLSLINDTLDLSKIESGVITLKPTPINCGEMIQKILAIVKPMMDAKHIHFTLDNSHAIMAAINVDVLRLQEVFVNLFSNAVKFTPENGSITLAIECVKLEKNVLHDRITVSDTGCGMSPEFLPHLFEPFSQERTEKNANVGGSGLGLSIVKKLVEMMGGTITVKSELNKGTSFTVSVAFERIDDTIARTPEVADTERQVQGLRILLCEDNEMNTEIAKSLLEMHGVTVTCTRNGQEGFDTFTSSAPGTFDAILMDIRMPVLNGYDAVQKIRASSHKEAATIPVIAMSADAYDDDVKKSREAGMNGHISKPIDPEKLFSELVRVTK